MCLKITSEGRQLTSQEAELLSKQDSRLVPEFKAKKFTKESKKHWDLFYKRNETRFFKDRHWTTREFLELCGNKSDKRVLLEVGCGVGNFFYPLIQEDSNLFVFACDFSPRAVSLVKENKLYQEEKVLAFQHDITESLPENVTSVDVASLIFVLSALVPDKLTVALQNVQRCLKPGGKILFRDYAINDHAM
jgi:methyltransferase-like protein 6